MPSSLKNTEKTVLASKKKNKNKKHVMIEADSVKFRIAGALGSTSPGKMCFKKKIDKLLAVDKYAR